jgi:hypothetical protein
MGKIYNIKGQGEDDMSPGCEIKQNDYEQKFVIATAELVMDLLNIGYNEKRIVLPLLVNGMKEKMNNRWKDPGFLQQYAASQLDEAAGRFYYELGVPKEVIVNHEHAPHAKYADIVDWIKKNYSCTPPTPKEPEK